MLKRFSTQLSVRAFDMLLATNAKLQRSTAQTAHILLTGLTLAPHSLSGFDVCSGASSGCRESCNSWFSGRRVTPVARYRAVGLTRWLFEDRQSFLEQLHRDIAKHVRRAERAQLRPVIRLNIGSDLDWTEVIERWPFVQFFDYTKVRSRFERYLNGQLPQNYALTFSRHEKHRDSMIRRFLTRGGNVAQVFDDHSAFPEVVSIARANFRVVDGEKHDVRLPEFDGSGVIVGLRLKGTTHTKEKARRAGFAT